MRAPAARVLVLAATAACTVPDKFYTDAGGGDDAVDAGADADPDDDDPPETTITSAPAEFDDSGAATFEFEADEDATFTCTVDGDAPVDCASPYTVDLADGPHTFAVRATDTAGNPDDTPAEHVWQIDTAAPDTTITTAPAAVDNSVDVSFEFTSDESPVTFECKLDTAAFAPCTSPRAYAGITRGSHTFEVRAIDQAGNVDASPDTHAWMIDTSAPDTTIDTGPTGAVASAAAMFTFSSPDAGGGATFECSLDGGAFAACTSPRAYTGLSEATHTFAVRVRDSGGNVDPTPATRMWIVDLTAPTTTIAAGPTGPTPSTSATFQFTSNESPVTFQCNLDGGGFATCPATHQLTGLSQGDHTLQVRAVDAAGNLDATPASRTWTVDTVPPNTSFVSGPMNPTNLTTATFDLSSSETGVTYQCALDGGAFGACTDPHTITVGEGAHTRQARAIDAAGNVDASPASYPWTVDTTGPVVTITSGPANNGTSGPYVTFTFTVSEGNPRCIIDGGQPTACTSPISFSLPDAPHTFRVEASDPLGNVGAAQRAWDVNCAPATGGPGALGLFHMDETQGQVANNSIAGVPDAQLGSSTDNDPSDPDIGDEGRYGRGYRFTSSERDFVIWNAGQASSHNFTIELWAMPVLSEDNDLYTTGVPAVGGPGRVRLFWGASDNVVRVVFQITDDQGNARFASSGQIPLDRWAHIVATFDTQNTMTLYVNGVADTSSASVSGSFSWGTHHFGHRQISLNGRLDEVFFGTQAMTATDVLNRYCPQ